MNKYLRILILAAVVICLGLLGLVFIRNLIDFPVYYSAGRSLLAGRTDLYAPDFARGQIMDYRYPPLFLLIFYPLWLLPYKAAAYVWYALMVLQITGCVIAIKGILGKAYLPAKVWLVTFFAVAQYFVMILHYGNAHLLAILLLFAAFYCYFHRRDFTAAALISLSITIKLTPVLILPYFALKKRWTLLLAVAMFLVALNLLPATYFGFNRNVNLINNWFHHVVIDQEFHEVNGPINLSLKGQIRRYTTEIDYSKRVDGDVGYPAINLTLLSTTDANRLWYGAGSIVFLCGLLLIWRGRVIREMRASTTQNAPGMIRPLRDNRDDSGQIIMLELGLMVCLMLFIGPLTSKIYFISLLWPVTALASYAFNNGGPAATLARRVVMVVAVTNCVLPLLPGSSIQRLLLVVGVDFYLNLLLMAAQGYALCSTERAIQASSGGLQTPALSETRTS